MKAGDEPASRGQTKVHFERDIDAQLFGKTRGPTRLLANAVVVFAQDVKHSSSPTLSRAAEPGSTDRHCGVG